MHWIPYIVFLYAAAVVQTTVGGVLTFHPGDFGAVGPDFLAILTVFVALHVKGGVEAALAAWAAGMAIDLTAAGGADSVTVLGPMSLAYVFGATIVYQIREAFFRERPLPQAILTLLFCLTAHFTYLTLQTLLAGQSTVGWALYGKRLCQASALAVYTAVLMPIVHWGLGRIRGWILVAGGEASRRKR